MKDIDWKILYELYLTPNITKVAEKLYMAQPTLTRRIQEIEEEFQTRILIRSNKGVVFTKEGEYLFHQAQLYLQFRSGIERRMEAFKQEGSGMVRVASSVTFAKQHLPGLILEFQKAYPNVSFDIQTDKSHYLTKFLTDGTSDLAFVRGNYDCELYKRRIMAERAYVVSARPVRKEDFLNGCRVDCIMGDSSRRLLEMWWNQNFKELPSSMVTVRFVDIAWELVQEGVGYTLGFFDSEKLAQSGLWYKEICYGDGTPVERGTWLIYSKETKKTDFTQAFIDLVERWF